MKPSKKNFDFKGFFFFIISLGSFLLLLYILYHEIEILRQNLSNQNQKIEIEQKEVVEKKVIPIQNTYSTAKKEIINPTFNDKPEKKIIIKVGVFKNRKNIDKIVSMLKKEKCNYKVVGKGIYKIYVFAKNEKEKIKIFSLLESKNIKPVIVTKIEG